MADSTGTPEDSDERNESRAVDTPLRYAHVLAVQIATAVACVHFHLIRPRLARLLLMIRDRSHSDTFTVTQAQLGEMLGVRRVGISAEAAALQEEGVIRYSRGSMSILDSGALHAIACGCYDADRRAYLDLLEQGGGRKGGV